MGHLPPGGQSRAEAPAGGRRGRRRRRRGFDGKGFFSLLSLRSGKTTVIEFYASSSSLLRHTSKRPRATIQPAKEGKTMSIAAKTPLVFRDPKAMVVGRSVALGTTSIFVRRTGENSFSLWRLRE